MRLREQTFPQYFEGYRRLRLVSTIDILALNQEQVETVMTNLIDTEELHLKRISLDWTTASCDVLPSAVVTPPRCPACPRRDKSGDFAAQAG